MVKRPGSQKGPEFRIRPLKSWGILNMYSVSTIFVLFSILSQPKRGNCDAIDRRKDNPNGNRQITHNTKQTCEMKQTKSKYTFTNLQEIILANIAQTKSKHVGLIRLTMAPPKFTICKK